MSPRPLNHLDDFGRCIVGDVVQSSPQVLDIGGEPGFLAAALLSRGVSESMGLKPVVEMIPDEI